MFESNEPLYDIENKQLEHEQIFLPAPQVSKKRSKDKLNLILGPNHSKSDDP